MDERAQRLSFLLPQRYAHDLFRSTSEVAKIDLTERVLPLP